MRLFYSAVNLHSRHIKSRSKLAHLFGYSSVPYSTRLLFQLLLLGNIGRLGEHAWTAQFRLSPWQPIKMYSLFYYQYLYMLMQSVFNQKGKVMFQSLKLLPWKQSLKNQVSKKYLVFFGDLLNLKLISSSLGQLK